jgi:hypothetical protein
MKVCSIEGCNGKHKGYGYCDKHYQRLKRHGDVTAYFKKKQCSVEGCTDKYNGKGYCNKHYIRMRDHGDVNHERGSKFKSRLEAYESCVVKTDNDSCWGWTGSAHDYGYGVLPYKTEKIRAHRFSYSHFVGEIPKGLFVLHKCDNPPCTNPNHLFLGTNLDNINDCIKKGRHPFTKYKDEKNDNAEI